MLRIGRGLGRPSRGCGVVLLGFPASMSRRPCQRAGAAGLMSCPSLAEGHVDDSGVERYFSAFSADGRAFGWTPPASIGVGRGAAVVY